MPRPLTRFDSAITVYYGRAILLDEAGLVDQPYDDRPALDELPGEEWFETAYNGANLNTEHGDCVAHVVAELWDGPPPDEPGWDEVSTKPIYFSSGVLLLTNVLGDADEDDRLSLGRRESGWLLQAHTRAAAGSPLSDTDQHFLLRLWPHPDSKAMRAEVESGRLRTPHAMPGH